MHIYIQRKKLQKKLQKTTKFKVLSKITKIIDTHSLCEDGKPIQRKLSGAWGSSRAAQKTVKVFRTKIHKVLCLSKFLEQAGKQRSNSVIMW